MIEYRRLKLSEREEFEALVETVIDSLERKDFFMPYSKEEIDAIFTSANVIAYGAYHNGKMVGTAQLFEEDELVEQIKAAVGLAKAKAAEFGGVLVLPEYRGQGIMKHFAGILRDEAKAKGLEYIVSIAHPENTASNRGITSMGAKLAKCDKLGEYTRNMYFLALTEK